MDLDERDEAWARSPWLRMQPILAAVGGVVARACSAWLGIVMGAAVGSVVVQVTEHVGIVAAGMLAGAIVGGVVGWRTGGR